MEVLVALGVAMWHRCGREGSLGVGSAFPRHRCSGRPRDHLSTILVTRRL